MRKIKFSRKWSKLSCKAGDIFTTIRSYNERKHDYYRGLVGSTLEVEIEGKVEFEAKLLLVIKVNSEEISRALLVYDCDGNAEWMKKFESGDWLILIFQKV